MHPNATQWCKQLINNDFCPDIDAFYLSLQTIYRYQPKRFSKNIKKKLVLETYIKIQYNEKK